MSTPLANKTTVSSRMKMASALTTIKAGASNHNNNNNTTNTKSAQTASNGVGSMPPPRTTLKPPASSRITVDSKKHLAATTSRITPPRSRLAPVTSQALPGRLGSLMAPTAATIQRTTGSSFSRSSSKMSSISSAVPRVGNCNDDQVTINERNSNLTSSSITSATSAHAPTVRKSTTTSTKSTYVPDTNSMRKGLAKFQNPIECQRIFQALNLEKGQLTKHIDNQDKKIIRLQEQLADLSKQGVGYATVVQYFAKKLRIDSDGIDLETEYQQLKNKVEMLLKNESEYEERLEKAVEDFKKQLVLEQDLKENIQRELTETKREHSEEITRLRDAQTNELNDLINQHTNLKQELEARIKYLEIELNARAKELAELRKDHEALNDSYNKLEESLTKDKDARVKFVQDKATQLQKEVDSLNSVLEMRNERMHALEKDSIMLSEAQQELMTSRDINKSLRQQLESMNAALDNKRKKFEELMSEREKLDKELKKERRERRRMTMRTEQLEYTLNESFVTENHATPIKQMES